MFVVVELKDTVRIPPDEFHLPIDEAVASQLNRKMANRVIIDVGLGITLFDILDIQKSFICQGDAASHTKGIVDDSKAEVT